MLGQVRPVEPYEVGVLYTYVKPILASEIEPGVEEKMYKQFLKDCEIGDELNVTGDLASLFMGIMIKNDKVIVLPKRLLQEHFRQNATSQSRGESAGGKKTRRHRRKTMRRKHKKRYSRKYRK
jgi:hypothetical protein